MKLSRAGAIIFGLLVIAVPPCLAEESAVKRAAMLPVRGAGVCLGMMVGTPIAIGRLGKKAFHEYMYGDTDVDGSPAGVVTAIPMGFGQGFAQGLFYGPKNAITNFDKPFSKDQMSLGAEVIAKPN